MCARTQIPRSVCGFAHPHACVRTHTQILVVFTVLLVASWVCFFFFVLRGKKAEMGKQKDATSEVNMENHS